MKMKVTIDNLVYSVEIEDVHARPVIALVEGERVEVWPEEESVAHKQAQPETPLVSAPEPISPSATPSFTSGNQHPNQVLAPLPGVIVAVLVKSGDQVARGQELCTLEAMKMKNAIKSSREGIIDTIAVNIGDQVNHGQMLMSFKA
jgi:biotin carboxyl carrier protein